MSLARQNACVLPKGTSTLLNRKMRPRPRLRFWPTQRPCKRVSSSCRQYEVFGNFAWRSAPPRKRVTQSRKAPVLRDRECPRPTRLSVDSLLHSNKGNGNGGNSVRKGDKLYSAVRRVLILFLSRRFLGRLGMTSTLSGEGCPRTPFVCVIMLFYLSL